jgi:GTP cyclohydrolase I
MKSQAIPDIQSSHDSRNLAIDKVGIKSIRHPIRIAQRNGETQHSIGVFDLYVRLAAELKGTHMSRFVQLLESQTQAYTPASFEALLKHMLKKLEARAGSIEMRFPYFVNKIAPVSEVHSLMDYEVSYSAEVRDEEYRFTLKVEVPVTSLCPCSKQISRYGAHNQRSHLTLTVQALAPQWIEDLIDIAERQASSQLYGLLKRPDEKFVTERAYENPKFVEDLVRDVATELAHDPRIAAFVVESENFESIHNHSAYALIASE